MKILVAGGTGALGREVVTLLAARGHWVRLLTRSAARANAARPPAGELFEGDATQAASLAGVCKDIDIVFSCLGASVDPAWSAGRDSFYAVDTRANINLIEQANTSGVSKFVYVSAFGAPGMRHLQYMDAHERVVDSLRGSGLPFAVLRPTGFFSALAALMDLARKGPLPEIGNGESRTNPIHEKDLAQVAVDILEKQTGEHDIGGPEVYTRHQIAEAAFSALQRPTKIRRVPPGMMRMAAMCLRPIQPRLSHLIQFVTEVATHDCIAPKFGTERLEPYFVQRGLKIPDRGPRK